ncbi:MAG: MazG nucleotide pyrophosphohydrolase domain protein [Erysipelotrichaceae bacterium]|nr:MAG: MazG nucleotide pyrophosphohydrolase domain [Erysipelotrichaceae bacterium]TXT17269.1 MAG: MazG nucleotide pyrophosphohydrolase domain protein [Erysipelotrichaceae bacterium]
MNELLDKIQALRIVKGWDKTDTPEILAKSIVVEAAELLACYTNDEHDLSAIKSELADVLMYVLSLCRDLDLDPAEVVLSKFDDIHKRYPDQI